jgi:hypothetical protein
MTKTLFRLILFSVAAGSAPCVGACVGAGALSGTVRSTSGAPLSGMTVQAWAAGALAPVVISSDAAGSYRLSLPAGLYRVLAFDPAGFYATDFYALASSFESSTSVAVGDGQSVTGVDFALATAGFLVGFIRDASSGAALSGITVAAYNADGTARGFALTPADGSFVLALPPGSYRLGAFDTNRKYVPTFYAATDTDTYASASFIPVSALQTSASLSLSLPHAGIVAGSVRDAETGVALAGLRLDLYTSDGTRRFGATTDAVGGFALAAAPGSYRLGASDPSGRYRPEFYPDVTSFANAPPVPVAADQTSGGLDFSLLLLSSSTTEERFVVAAAQSAGVGGTFFTTDLSALNPSAARTAHVVFSWLPSGGGDNSAATTASRDLLPGAQLFVSEAVATLFQRTGGGAIRIVSDAPLIVSTRTATPAGALAPGGSFGLGIPGVTRERSILAGRIPGISVDAATRTNVGFLNPGPASITIALALFDSTGASLANGSVTLAPYGHFQANTIASYLGVTALFRNASLRVSSSSPFFAYATPIDQATGDSSFVAAETE